MVVAASVRGEGFRAFGFSRVQVLCAIVPWIGVMAVGYSFGAVAETGPERPRRLCYGAGGTALLLFFILRATDVYGNPRPWRGAPMPAFISFINTAKSFAGS